MDGERVRSSLGQVVRVRTSESDKGKNTMFTAHR